MENKPKLMIATPCGQSFPMGYVVALNSTHCRLSGEFRLGLGLCESPLVHANRNNLFMTAFNDKVDYMLFVDSDMVWRPDDIRKMVDFGRPVVTGVCLSRKTVEGYHIPAIYRKTDGRYFPVMDIPDSPFKVDGCGAAFLLITKEVIEKLAELIPVLGYPFDYIPTKDAEAAKAADSNFTGEDLAFCQRLRQADFDIWCLPDVNIGHIGTEIIKRGNNG